MEQGIDFSQISTEIAMKILITFPLRTLEILAKYDEAIGSIYKDDYFWRLKILHDFPDEIDDLLYQKTYRDAYLYILSRDFIEDNCAKMAIYNMMARGTVTKEKYISRLISSVVMNDEDAAHIHGIFFEQVPLPEFLARYNEKGYIERLAIEKYSRIATLTHRIFCPYKILRITLDGEPDKIVRAIGKYVTFQEVSAILEKGDTIENAGIEDGIPVVDLLKDEAEIDIAYHVDDRW